MIFHHEKATQMKRTTASDLGLIAVMAGVTAALGLIPPITIAGPVPITAQSMGPMLTGAVLGARRGAISQTLFTALVAVGLPLLAGGKGGIAPLVGPTAGFIFGWILVAFLVGLVTDRMRGKYNMWLGLLANVVFGIVVLYLVGTIGVSVVAGVDYGKAMVGNIAFIPGDLLKAVLAAVIAMGVHAAIPDLLQPAKATQPQAVAADAAPVIDSKVDRSALYPPETNVDPATSAGAPRLTTQQPADNPVVDQQPGSGSVRRDLG